MLPSCLGWNNYSPSIPSYSNSCTTPSLNWSRGELVNMHMYMSHVGIHDIIYKYKNHEVGCRDDTVPKTGDTRRHCEVELTVCNNLPQPPPYISFFGGCGRLLHTVNSTSQCLLVSPVFGTVSSLHPTSDFYIYTNTKQGRTCTVH